MPDKPTVRVRGRKSAREKPITEKPKRSAWLYTISTNQRYEDDDANLEEDEEVFGEVIEGILNNIGNYLNFKIEGDSFTGEKVQNVSCDYVIERGGKTKALHAHILIQITHYSRIHLNYEAVKHKIEEEIGCMCYMNGKLVRPTSETYLMDYLNKAKAGTDVTKKSVS